jgi:hypothetical protein
MAELEIPEAAKDAAVSALAAVMADKRTGGTEHAAVCVASAAAPIIVAAELRRLADELYDGPQRWPASKVQLLRDRADELDASGDEPQ